MELEGKRSHVIDTLFVLCLLFLFIFSAITVIIIGAGIYKKNVEAMSGNYSHRIACAYISEKVRQADVKGRIFTQDIFGQKTLVMQDETDGELYNTYIYNYDGYLMELYARSDLQDIYPQAGMKILKISSFNIEELNDSCFKVSVTLDDGAIEDFLISKRSVDDK
ncbi:MAG: DUF4860 domain-containing protein [Butyrivibrio sp.]|nr:DUF4860 domain-containing protein [Butyrivibrio sp.]